MKIAWFPRDRDALDDVVECDPLTAITEHFFVYFWHDVSPLITEKPRLKIGRYCSIGLECEFMLGGNHRHDWASQFAFPAFMPECKAENYLKAKGDIVVGHDVWMGFRATVLSGVKIGNGAVIGTHSVVTTDIPAYAIAAGNPARVVKYRFSPDKIAQLEALKWWDWPREKIIACHRLLMDSDIDALVAGSAAEN